LEGQKFELVAGAQGVEGRIVPGDPPVSDTQSLSHAGYDEGTVPALERCAAMIRGDHVSPAARAEACLVMPRAAAEIRAVRDEASQVMLALRRENAELRVGKTPGSFCRGQKFELVASAQGRGTHRLPNSNGRAERAAPLETA
jgi:hypothetical protein